MSQPKLVEVYSAEQITARVKELAGLINREYEGKNPVMICILKGAFMFFADLTRHITCKPEMDFLRVASYGNTDTSSGTVKLIKDVEISLRDRHVLLVEDIVDSGLTMRFLVDELRRREVKSLRIAALIDKFERREVELTVDYPGFTLDKGFLVGYGLDFAEKYRELPAVYSIHFE
ncbi:hypoxanthine phosphoribosyltransferase [Desulfovibrio sp. OttesenSCG-928-M14]|nr:hypoxanthine phosphoribosyltransferase [Desulfovibrio sp. OttesenSCG-928-M16]MDL2216762.1 hypoxanthine phosphoribosyltransferase [Desulfovibrio sp. OttesenSCG-928-M14]